MKTKKVKQAMLASFAAVALVLLLAGCGGGGGTPPAAGQPQDDTRYAAISGHITIRGVTDYSGVVVVAEKVEDGVTARVAAMLDSARKGKRVAPDSIAASAENGIYTTTTDPQGGFSMSVPRGTYSVSAFKNDTVAAQPQRIDTRSGSSVVVDFELVATGSVSGTISSSDSSMIRMAYLEGTSFAGFADSGGAYTISNVPVGSYNIVFARGGIILATNTGIVVIAGENTNNSLTSWIVACFSKSDCDDGNETNYDICVSPGTTGSYCDHLEFACNTNADCDDGNPLTIHDCINPSTDSAYCTTTAIVCNTNADCGGAASLCNNGGTADSVCTACIFNTDCDDAYPSTLDTCVNAGAANASCTHEAVACYSNADCSGATPYCANAGTPDSLCAACTENSQCNDGNPNTYDACVNPGTASAACSVGTPASGIIWTDTTWTKAGSPYVVNGLIQIDASATLTIEPGVTVMYAGAYSIEVQGAIIANGTSTENIIFTSAVAGQNSGATMIYFKSVANLDLSQVSYIRAEWGTTGIANSSTTGSLTVSNSTFTNNSSGGISNGIGMGPSGTLTVSNSTFSDNSGGGISNLAGSMTVSNSTFSDNSGGGIYNDGALTVSNSTFSNNSGAQGSGIGNFGSLTVSNSTFTNNSEMGIYNGGSMTVSNSTFTNNSSPYGGGGIFNGGNTSSLTVSNSTFTDNSGGGIFNDYGSMTVSYSTINSTSGLSGPALYGSTNTNVTYTDISGYAVGVEGAPTTFHHNNIYNNSQYNFKITGATNVTVANNWWGTTDTSTINAKIYDYYDNINLGKVLYTPILTAPEPTAGDPD